MKNKLILLSLPIGNLSDLTVRAREILETKKVFIVEDTRTFYSLLEHLQIQKDGKRVISFHDQSEDERIDQLLQMLEHDDLVIASEAGSPLISDPAFPLVRRALEREWEIDSIPGVSAVLVALELSGLPPHPFHFYAFFPRETDKRKQMMKRVEQNEGTHIFFESPHRILDLADEMAKEFPHSSFAIGRELTKLYQTVYRFKGEEWSEMRAKVMTKGEFVLLVHTQGSKMVGVSAELKENVQSYLERPSTKTLSKIFGEILGESPKEIYQKILKGEE